MGEASVLLGKVYGSLGQLSTRLSAVHTGVGKKFPQMFFLSSHVARMLTGVTWQQGYHPEWANN